MGLIADHPRRVLAVTSIGSFMGPLDITVVALALPVMGRELGLSFSGGIWVSALYLVVYTLVLVPAGRLADEWGRLRVWRIGAAIFVAASLASGLAHGSVMLLISRAFQGVGGAILASTAAALITAVYPPQHRGRAIGINVTILYLGLATGPLIGGLIAQHLGWRWIFLVNIPVGLAALAISADLQEERLHRGRPRLDLPGTALLGAGLALTMVALTFGPLWGWTSGRVLALGGLGIALLAAFVVAELHTDAPLVDLGLFRRSRIFAAGSIAALLNYTAMFGVITLTAILLQVEGQRSAAHAGWILVVTPSVMVLLTPFAGRLSDRIGSRLLSTSGMIIVAAGLVVLSMVPDGAPTDRVISGLLMVGVGMALFSSPNTSAVMGAAPRERLAVASSIVSMMRSTGQTLSLAILGTIAAAPLGPDGGSWLFRGEGGVEYLGGYHRAMLAGAVIAVVGAVASSVRGPVKTSG